MSFSSRHDTRYKHSIVGKSLICSQNKKKTILQESSAWRMVKDTVEVIRKSQIIGSLGAGVRNLARILWGVWVGKGCSLKRWRFLNDHSGSYAEHRLQKSKWKQGDPLEDNVVIQLNKDGSLDEESGGKWSQREVAKFKNLFRGGIDRTCQWMRKGKWKTKSRFLGIWLE